MTLIIHVQLGSIIPYLVVCTASKPGLWSLLTWKLITKKKTPMLILLHPLLCIYLAILRVLMTFLKRLLVASNLWGIKLVQGLNHPGSVFTPPKTTGWNPKIAPFSGSMSVFGGATSIQTSTTSNFIAYSSLKNHVSLQNCCQKSREKTEAKTAGGFPAPSRGLKFQGGFQEYTLPTGQS